MSDRVAAGRKRLGDGKEKKSMTEREIARKKAAARKQRARKQRARRAVLTVALMLVVCVASIGGTIAWLQDDTTPVKNTFTSSNIEIELSEDGAQDDGNGNLAQSFQMIPGHVIDKKPIVTVKEGSEDCYVFLKVNGQNTADYLEWGINTANWTLLEQKGDEYVYYCEATNVTADRPISVLGYQNGGEFVKDQVKVKHTVTKEMMERFVSSSYRPVQLTFEAHAIQLYKTNGQKFTPAEAWETLFPDDPEDELPPDME